MDVSKENDTFNIDKTLIPPGYTLAAVSWLVSLKSVVESRLAVLRLVISLVSDRMAGYGIWLIIGNSAWQPNTRIVKHRGLWGALKARGVGISHAENLSEEMVEADGKIKFFGAKKISELSAESVVNAIAEEHCSYLLALPDGTELVTILRKGWIADNGFDQGLLSFVANNKGVIFKAVGEFDDPTAGFVAISSPELVKTLKRKG